MTFQEYSSLEVGDVVSDGYDTDIVKRVESYIPYAGAPRQVATVTFQNGGNIKPVDNLKRFTLVKRGKE